MLSQSLALILLTQSGSNKLPGQWRGEYVLTIKGEGTIKNSTSTARFKINRESRGTIILDRGEKGASIAGSPEYNNLSRYESWNGNYVTKQQGKIKDEVIQRGPLFHPKNIRRDTLRVTAPADPVTGEWATGELGWPTFQIDLKENTFMWDAPRIEVPSKRYFQREFVEGPKDWTSNKPIVEDKVELGYQIIHDLNQPREWFRITGKFKPGQTELNLSKKFAFSPMLMQGLTPPKLEAEWTLVLKKQN